MDELRHIESKALSEIASATVLAELDEVRVRYLGKKGELTGFLKGLGQLPLEKRPAAGAEINKVKEVIQNTLVLKKELLDSALTNVQLAAETIDVTLPGRRSDIGALHPVTLVLRRMERVLASAQGVRQRQPNRLLGAQCRNTRDPSVQVARRYHRGQATHLGE